MIGLIAHPLSKGGRILAPSSRSYKGGRFLGQHGGGKLGRGGRILGSKAAMSSMRRVLRPKAIIREPIVKTVSKRPVRKAPVRRKRKAPIKRSRGRPSRRHRKSKGKSLANTLGDSVKSAIKSSGYVAKNAAKNVLKNMLSSGKSTLNSSAKQLVKDAPKMVLNKLAKSTRKRAMPDADPVNDGYVPPPNAKRARYHGPPSVKRGYLSGTKQYGGLRLF